MKFIIGNWKMNGDKKLLNEMESVLADVTTENKVVLCVPFTLLGAGNGKVALGAQDVSAHEKGAYTGEVSASMLVTSGAKYVIVGHSERRAYHGETNEDVRAKAEMALENGITPIICVGETMEEKRVGRTFEIIEKAVRESVPKNVQKDIIIAYEPRWAIGAGITPTRQEITEAHKLIADTLGNMDLAGTPILYGASVNGSNVAEIVSIENVDGVLVGGASLKPGEFVLIINNAK